MEHVARELAEIVTSVASKLAQMEDTQAGVKLSDDQWSKKEIIGHLIDSAANNHQRFVRAQIETSLVFPPYAQEAWVQRQAYQFCPWLQLLEIWKWYNLHLAWIIRQIPAEALDRECIIGDNPTVNLGFLITDYLSHLKLHLEQLGL